MSERAMRIHAQAEVRQLRAIEAALTEYGYEVNP